VTLLRRKRLPDRLLVCHRAFLGVRQEVDDAKSVLAQAAPTTRMAGRPLVDVLAEYEEHLGHARAGMQAWRAPELAAEWDSCRRALDRAASLGERVRMEAEAPAGFEALIGVLDALSAPLEVFDDTEQAFRALRA